jgi:hypothetical protein
MERIHVVIVACRHLVLAVDRLHEAVTWPRQAVRHEGDPFFVGFGPTCGRSESGETEYGVKAIPGGGFVRSSVCPTEEERRGAGRARSRHEGVRVKRTDRAGGRLVTMPFGS